LQLREYFVMRFGEEWWQNPAAGKYLVMLFCDGRKKRADDVVVQLGYNGLDSDYYQKHYIEGLIRG
ncbi:hypothetical protein K8T06_01295, partial [bacterium]|nr:hypothetical protein [bacterium]